LDHDFGYTKFQAAVSLGLILTSKEENARQVHWRNGWPWAIYCSFRNTELHCTRFWVI